MVGEALIIDVFELVMRLYSEMLKICRNTEHAHRL